MKVFIVINVARQYLGDYVLVKVEKVFQEMSSAQIYFDSQIKNQIMKISTPVGDLECLCERNIVESEVEYTS